MMRRRGFRLVAVLLAGVAAAGLAVGVGVVVARSPFDDGENHIVNPAEITPLPFYGYPATIEVPDFSNPPKCQYPADERPSPDLPPLSCRNSGAEPTPGAIPTAPPQARPDVSRSAPGTKTIDNAIFRFTVTVPDDWYSDMRPEGGSFSVYDPASTRAAAAKSAGLPFGLNLSFSARRYVQPLGPPGDIEKRLATPDLKLGAYDGALWDEGPAEGFAHWLMAVYIRDGVLYQIDAYVFDGGRSEDLIEADVQLATDIIKSVTPY